MQAPIAVSRRQEVEAVIDEVVERMGPDVVYVRYNFGEDWSGDPALYFRVVLSDETSDDAKLRLTSRRVRALIDERMDALNLGVFVYIAFRGRSEQESMKDPDWA